jgi:hypothetical protein
VILIRSLRIRNEAPILVGHLYEAFAHLVLSEGGCFRTRAANGGAVNLLQLEKKKLVHLRKRGDIKNVAANEYGQGHNTFAAFDVVSTNPHQLFNTMVTEDTECRIDGKVLLETFTHMESFPKPCNYYWVVPSDKFDAFTEQPASGMRSEELATYITQFVVEVPIATHHVDPQVSRGRSEDEKSPEKKKAKIDTA